MNLLDLMLDLKITRVSQAKENVVFFPQGPTGHIDDETFSFNMKENECKKEAPPPYSLLSINGAENRHTMKIKPDVGAVIFTQISSLGHL